MGEGRLEKEVVFLRLNGSPGEQKRSNDVLPQDSGVHQADRGQRTEDRRRTEDKGVHGAAPCPSPARTRLTFPMVSFALQPACFARFASALHTLSHQSLDP
jgi:hypothetical protein